MRTRPSRPGFIAGLAIATVLAATGCDSAEPPSFTPGPLGAVSLAPGEPIEIRALLSVTGAPGLAPPIRRGMELAVQDLGAVHGREIRLGETVDEMCSPDGGRQGARAIVGDDGVVGIVGTVCSAAAVEAAVVVDEAGFAMISPANTSPLLTSDLAGGRQTHYREGYYRVSNNGTHNGIAVSQFAYRELGLRRVVTVDDGDAYTTALASAFRGSFQDLGGEAPAALTVEKGQTDMTSVLAEIARNEADGVFLPLFVAEASALARAVKASDFAEDVALISDAAALVAEFLATPESEGMYFAGPQADFGDNVNRVTGQSAAAVLERYRNAYGAPPGSQYWAHAYDATTLLVSAVRTAGAEHDDTLHIDRAELRKALNETTTTGLVGPLDCDDFGDCGTGRLDILHHTDPSVTDIARLAVVYRYDPSSTGSAARPPRR